MFFFFQNDPYYTLFKSKGALISQLVTPAAALEANAERQIQQEVAAGQSGIDFLDQASCTSQSISLSGWEN